MKNCPKQLPSLSYFKTFLYRTTLTDTSEGPDTSWMRSSSTVTIAWAAPGWWPTEELYAAALAAYPGNLQARLTFNGTTRSITTSDDSAVTICSCKQQSLHWKWWDPQLQALLITQGSSEYHGGPSRSCPGMCWAWWQTWGGFLGARTLQQFNPEIRLSYRSRMK